MEALRQAWPGVKIRVRLDGGFASPKMFELLEWLRVRYIVAMAENSRLSKHAERLMKKARRLQKQTGQTARVFGECMYAAGSWKKKQRRVNRHSATATVYGGAAAGCPWVTVVRSGRAGRLSLARWRFCV